MKLIQNKSNVFSLSAAPIIEKSVPEDVAVPVDVQQVIKEQRLISKDVVLKLVNAEIKAHQKIEQNADKANGITYTASDALKSLKDKIRNLN